VVIFDTNILISAALISGSTAEICVRMVMNRVVTEMLLEGVFPFDHLKRPYRVIL